MPLAHPIAFYHNNVHNPYVHAILDLLTVAVATAPLWTAYFWGGRRRGLLLALVAVVQIPVAVIGFVPIANPLVHVVAFATALTLTAFSLAYVRRAARALDAAPSTESRSVLG
jgi:hypothetical protein